MKLPHPRLGCPLPRTQGVEREAPIPLARCSGGRRHMWGGGEPLDGLQLQEPGSPQAGLMPPYLNNFDFSV